MVRLGVRVSTGGSEESPEIVARRTAMETNHSGFSFFCLVKLQNCFIAVLCVFRHSTFMKIYDMKERFHLVRLGLQMRNLV
jgi:hypothetical protein